MKLTIKQFQQINHINKLEIDDLDKSIMFVQVLTGKSEFEVNQMKVKKFNKLCSDVLKAFESMMVDLKKDKPTNLIKANGTWYWINYDVSKLDAGRYVETATFGVDLLDNLHKLMATMVVPMKWTWKGLKPIQYDAMNHEKVAEDMLQADFTHCYHASVFFYALFKNSIISLESYLESQTEKKEELKRAMMNFKNLSDGFTMPNWYQNLKLSV
jgi:hypothetical protein